MLMPVWTSIKEKQYWFWALLIYITILSTLLIGQPLAIELQDQNVQAIFFLLGMVLVATAVIIHGLVNRPAKIEYAIIFGIIAVYIMFFFRLGAPERSHLIEYSVLAVLLHRAFMDHFKRTEKLIKPAFLALLTGMLLGALDECIQILLPQRYFDPEDIVFNSLAVAMAIVGSLLLMWIRKKVNSPKNNQVK